MRTLQINSDYREIAEIQAPSQAEIDATISFTRASAAFALEYGGPIVHRFVKKIPPNWEPNTYQLLVIKSHLKPGFNPTAPGLHVDGEVGSNFGIPTFLQTSTATEHILGCFGTERDATLATTEFVVGPVMLTPPEEEDKIRKELGWWHHQITQQLADPNSDIKLDRIRPNTLVRYNHYAFHKSPMPETEAIRVLIRASRVLGQILPPNFENEMLKEEYAYKPTGNSWEVLKLS